LTFKRERERERWCKFETERLLSETGWKFQESEKVKDSVPRKESGRFECLSLSCPRLNSAAGVRERRGKTEREREKDGCFD
jgi:hypothetical protein